MAVRTYSRGRRILTRIPLRIALKATHLVALFSHRWYMAMALPLLKAAGMTFTGKPRYISPKVFFDDFDKVTLGERVVISSEVSLLTHDYSITTVLIAAGQHSGGDQAIVRPITIGRNVFIGRGSLLMPGTVVGNDVIVGAGSVVRGAVPDGTVVVGNPAEPVTTLAELYEKHKARAEAADIRQDKA